MVKVASMKRAKRILLIGGVLVLSVSSADAGIWGRKADKPAASAPAPSLIALSAIEIEGSRVLLRTNGAPAYTSYSPSPGVFVVDLTDTGRGPTVAIPAVLPPAVASLSADEVVEMGNRLTRVTFRFTEPLSPEVMAIEKAVVIMVPASAIPIESASAPAIEVLPAVTRAEPVVETATAEPIAEPIAEPTAEPIAEPVVETIAETPAEPIVEPVAAEIPLPRAKAVRTISASTRDGNVEVRIAGDGQLRYKAFRLESPSRLVIDLEGVKNAVTKNSVPVSDDVVQRVRIAHVDSALHGAWSELDALYRSPASDDEKRARKAEILARVSSDVRFEVNNATLVDARVYGAGLPELGALLDACGNDWSRFWKAVRGLRSSDFGEKQTEDLAPVLAELVQSGCPAAD